MDVLGDGLAERGVAGLIRDEITDKHGLFKKKFDRDIQDEQDKQIGCHNKS